MRGCIRSPTYSGVLNSKAFAFSTVPKVCLSTAAWFRMLVRTVLRSSHDWIYPERKLSSHLLVADSSPSSPGREMV